MHLERKSRGMTIIELVIVLAIAMVLAATTVPTILRTVNTFRLNGAVRNVAILIQRARYNAVVRNKTIGFAANSAGTFFYVDPNYTVPFSSYVPALTNVDPQLVDTGNINLVTSGVPSFSSMGFATTPTLLAPYNTGTDSELLLFSRFGTVSAINNNAASNIGVLCFQNAYGAYAAVSVTVNGATRVWQYQGGAWR